MEKIADYTLLEPLGSGNHGEFWLARPPARLAFEDGQLVALKVLGAHHSENDFRRMANELRVYAAAESTQLVPILEAGQQSGRLFYSTPYFADGSLAQPARPLDQRTIMSVLADAGEACHALHEAGVAHRDVKPGNILLHGARGLLGDLGLAQLLHPGQTATGLGPVGTVQFIAPEVVRGDPSSRASDIWSFGVTVHVALTGRPVFDQFEGKDVLEALRTILTAAPSFDDRLPPAVRPIVERCVAREPSERYPTAKAFAMALRESVKQ